MSEHRPIRLPRTVASNPARARVNWLRYSWYYPMWPLIWAGALAGCAFLILKVSLWFLFLLPPISLCIYIYWFRISGFFKNGDANPGIIVQLNPTLVAVATDLTKIPGFASYPAIKIFRTRLGQSMGQRPKLGMQLSTVAVYFDIPELVSPHWATFDPRPLECASGDRKTLKRVMESFPRAQRLDPEASIKLLPGVTPGLYRHFDHGWEKVTDTTLSDILFYLLGRKMAGFKGIPSPLERR